MVPTYRLNATTISVKETTVKYLLAIYSNPRNWAHPTFRHQAGVGDDDVAAMQVQFDELLAEITGSGELVEGVPLADPALARTIRVREGVAASTDGPYAEAKEQIAGYFLIDCESPERAAEIAARFPDARFGAVEVRPVMDLSGGLEM
ncbi:YciI family protein [Saccharopolyspora taberi]|uniref:YciI family protein n=1 Tax=Saccharopolyspora taberi TaxID=60895 RepID=A0ABN3VGJ8_9PSEU